MTSRCFAALKSLFRLLDVTSEATEKESPAGKSYVDKQRHPVRAGMSLSLTSFLLYSDLWPGADDILSDPR